MNKKIIISIIITFGLLFVFSIGFLCSRFLYCFKGKYTEEDIFNIAYDKLVTFLDIYDQASEKEIEKRTGIEQKFKLQELPKSKTRYKIIEDSVEMKDEGDSYTILVLYAKAQIFTDYESKDFDFRVVFYSPAFNIRGITEEDVNEPFNWTLRWEEIK